MNKINNLINILKFLIIKIYEVILPCKECGTKICSIDHDQEKYYIYKNSL